MKTDIEVFYELVDVMSSDNGFSFTASIGHVAVALPIVKALRSFGFFEDSPDDLDGSYWMAAAGKGAEAEKYFAKAAVAYEKLSLILNSIFDNGSIEQLVTDLGRV